MKKYEVVEFEAGDVLQFVVPQLGFTRGAIVVLVRNAGVYRLLGGNRDTAHNVTEFVLQELYLKGDLAYLGNINNKKEGKDGT